MKRHRYRRVSRGSMLSCPPKASGLLDAEWGRGLALVVAGRLGLTPGTMALGLGVSRSALSFHLKELSDGRQSWVPSHDWRSRPVSTPATFPAALRILA